MLSNRRHLFLSCAAILLGGCLDATNPFDPGTPVDQQEPASIVGYVVGVERDVVKLRLEDGSGQPVRDEKNDAELVIETRKADAPLPAGLEESRGKVFEFADLVPGTYTVVFDAALNEEPLLLDERAPPATLTAGMTAVRVLTPQPRPESEISGSVVGSVQGAQGGASFAVRLVPKNGDPELEKSVVLSQDGTFEFEHVPEGEYRVQAVGDTYAPASSAFFQVADAAVELPEPLQLTTLGKVFFVDDFKDAQGKPPFAPFVRASPVHVAVAPLAFADADVTAFARLYSDENRPAADDGWRALSGMDVLEAELDVDAGDGPRSLWAQLRLCFGSCTCPERDEQGRCRDATFQEPLVSREFEVNFVLDTSPPRAITMHVNDVVRTAFGDDAAALEAEPGVVSISCARFGDVECALAADTSTNPRVFGDVFDDTSRLIGYATTLDSDEEPTTFNAVLTAGPLARIQGDAPPIARQSGNHTLRVWAQDAAGNVGLVDVRTLVVDVEGLTLASPPLVFSGTTTSNSVQTLTETSLRADVQVTGTENPSSWRVLNGGTARAAGRLLDGLVPYRGSELLDVEGADGDTLELLVDVTDAVGNLTRSSTARIVRLVRTSSVTGTVALENREDATGASVALVNASGNTLLTVAAGGSASVDVGNAAPLAGSFLLEGTYSFTGVPVRNTGGVLAEQYTVVATGPSPYRAARTSVELRPAGPSTASPITLTLPRGALVGRFVLEGRETTLQNSGIQVSLFNELGDAVASSLSFADGTWRILDVAAGQGYTAVGFFDGFAQAEVRDIEVPADAVGVVSDDGTGAPTPVVLDEISADFRLCELSASLELACSPLEYTNLREVQVGGLTLNGVGRYRVSTIRFAPNDTEPPFVDVEETVPGVFVAPRVPLGDEEGRVTVFLQLESAGGSPGEVLQSELIVDRTPPANVSVRIARGRDALLNGFTGENVARVTVTANAGAGVVAPLRNAHVAFANQSPVALPAVTCAHDEECELLLEDADEGVHTAFAFSCDRAGNCTDTPARASVVLDTTPPSLTHGTGFAPGAPTTERGGEFFTRTPVFDLDVQTGRARSADNTEVEDLQGRLVADAVAIRASLNPFLDDGEVDDFTDIPALAPDRSVPMAGLASLPAVDGTSTVFVQFIDAAGNRSRIDPNSFVAAVTLDTRGPAISFALDGGNEFTRSTTVTLDVNDQSSDRAIKVQLNGDGLFNEDDPTSFVEETLPLLNASFTLTDGTAATSDGLYTVFGRFFDSAGNITERQDSIVLDRLPPEPLLVDCASCTIFEGQEYSRAANRTVTLNTLAVDTTSDVALVRTTVRRGGLSGLPAEQSFAGTVAVTLSVLNNNVPEQTDGTYQIDVVFVDEAGNASDPVTVPVTSDVNPPVAHVSINDGALFSRSASVTLTVEGTDATSPIAGVRIQNSTPTFGGSLQPLLSPLAHQLASASVDETKTVHLQVTDAAGNTAVAFAEVVLDTRAPTGTVTIAGGAARTNTIKPDVVLAYNASDANEFALTTLDEGFPADCAGVSFEPGPPPASTQVNLLETGGEPAVRTVSVCTRDAAGNTAMAFDTVILDETFPAGSVTLNGGATYTTSRTLTATLSAPTDIQFIKTELLGSTAVSQLNCDDPTGYALFTTATLTQAIAANDRGGAYVLRVCLKDSAGNVSVDATGAAAPVADTIIFDAAAPSVVLQINDDAPFTTSGTVKLSIKAEDDLASALGGIVSMRVANTTPSFAGAGEQFTSERITTVASPTTDDLKTVCVEVTDAAGQTATDCDDITLDLTPPSGTVTIARAVGNFSTDADAALSTTFRSGDLTIASVAFAQAPLDCAALDATAFTTIAANANLVREITVAPGEGTRSVTGCFKAQSGLISAITDTVFVDPVDPPLAQPIAPASASFVSTTKPTFSWAAVTGAVSYKLLARTKPDAATVLNQGGITALNFTPGTALPEQSIEWIVIAVKASGRESTVDFQNASTFTPDATAPTAATNLVVDVHNGRNLIKAPGPCTAQQPCLNDASPRLSFSPGTDSVDGSVDHIIEVALNGEFNSPSFTTTRTSNFTLDVTSPLEDGEYQWRVKTVDDAANETISAAAFFIVDRSPPDEPTIVPPLDPVSQTHENAIILGWSQENQSGAAQYRFELVDVNGTFRNPSISRTQTETFINVDGLLTAGDGIRHLFRVAALDALGNQSSFAISSFLHDSVAPCTTSGLLQVIGTDQDNQFTDSNVVTLEISCNGGNPARMQIGCDGTATGKPFVAFAQTAICVLPAGQGSRTVAVRVLDDANNPTDLQNDTITIDRTAPTTPILANGDIFTNQPVFNVTIAQASGDTNFSHHEIVDGFNLTTFTPFAPNSLSFPLQLTLEATYNVRVRGVDKAGNVSPEAIAKVTYDDTPPNGLTILGGAGPVFVNADSFTFSLAPSGSIDLNFDTFETASCAGLGCTPAGFVASPSSGVFTFNIAQNATTVFAVRARDKAGNVGPSASVTVFEDSQNPRRLALEPLPPTVLGGPPSGLGGFSQGAYVDVFLARTETSVEPSDIDPNFDHFEVRASTREFLGFVPVCETATALCAVPFPLDNAPALDGRTLIIRADSKIVGFRVPLERAADNTIVVRSVDKAGNVSLETSVSTLEIGMQRITSSADSEIGMQLFGDELAYLRRSDSALILHEAGPDQLWGTGDDVVAEIESGVFTAGLDIFTPPARAIALGPNQVFYARDSGLLRNIFRVTGGDDGRLGTTGDNGAAAKMSDDGVAPDVLETARHQEPSFWRNRLLWRQLEPSTPSDSDLIVRQAGTDGTFGNGDDTFVRIADDDVHQMHAVLSGDNVAWLSCSNADASQCPSATPFVLKVLNAGPDHIFGTGDDVGPTILANARNIDGIRLEMYTPGTPGRPACRNVLAYAGRDASKGVQVIAAGPDGVFEATEVPVQVMSAEAFGTGGLRTFSLYDTTVIAGDNNGGPAVEVTTAGRDGCLTRTGDNITFDSGIENIASTVHGNIIIGTADSPTFDLVWLELGAERPLWVRSEGNGSFVNADVGRDGVAFGAGSFYDFNDRQMRTYALRQDEIALFEGNLVHGEGSLGFEQTAPKDLFLRLDGVDQRFGTADDVEFLLSGAHPYRPNSSSVQGSGIGFAADAIAVAWSGKQTGSDLMVPVIRSVGSNQQFELSGDDCETEVNAPAEANYTDIRLSGKRLSFQGCGNLDCNIADRPLYVREVTGVNGDVCSGANSVVELVKTPGANRPQVEGELFIYNFNGVHVIAAGRDHRLTDVADNLEDSFLQPVSLSVRERMSMSGDRVVWIDDRSKAPRVVLGDVGDMSTRVLTRSIRTDEGVSLHGDVVHYDTARPNSFFLGDSMRYVIGPEPALSQDFANPGPTRLRCPTDDPFEENDSQATATALNNGGVASAILCAGDVDVWKVSDVPAGCLLRARIHLAHPDGDLDMTVFGPDGAVAGSSLGTLDDELVSVTPTAAGKYLIGVFSGIAGAEGAYDVGVTMSCP